MTPPSHPAHPAVPDYSGMTAEVVERVTDEALRAANALVDEIACSEQISWDATMGTLQEATTLVSDSYGRGAFMARVHPDADVRERGTAMEERLSKWGNDLVFRSDLYAAIKRFAESEEAEALPPDRRRLVEFWMRDFRRAGHELDDATRAELKQLQERLIELQVEFGRNLDEWKDHLELTREQLDGLPDEYVATLRPGDTAGTYRVTMEYPDYIPFMEQATDRDLRRRLQFKFWNRAADANRPLLAEAVELRSKIAVILGYPTWAHYAMEVKMAKEPDTVADFYAGIMPGLEKKAAEERAVVAAMFERNHPSETLSAWDWSFYHNEQKKHDYGVDANAVAAYFPLERVVEGMFDLTGEVFGLQYRRIEDNRAWHPDVFLYEILDRDSGESLAYFYADLFPRDGKYNHAAAFPITYGRREIDGTYTKPVAAIVANMTKPTAGTPSLLKHKEALTLFHEFGHILHFCLTTVDLGRFSGYDTEWDFVEAPSQIMEHWMWQPEVLQRFARHHQTDQPIPTDLIERLVAARDLNVGMHNMRQIFLGQLDLWLHDATPEKDLDAINRRAYGLTGLPFHEGTFFPGGFGHLMGGYDAGYYGYLWAKVYGDDMFSVFAAEGVTSPEVGRRYRDEVLARGGERDAMDHLRAFLQREPNSDAFLQNIGLG